MADDQDLPKALVDDLGAMFRSAPAIEPAVEDAILNRARARLLFRRRTRMVFRISGFAAAAAIALFAVHLTLNQAPPHATTALVALPQDVNADGQVDILDAFELARSVERSQGNAKWDFNGDGRVDRQDADAVAAAAVRLGGGAAR